MRARPRRPRWCAVWTRRRCARAATSRSTPLTSSLASISASRLTPRSPPPTLRRLPGELEKAAFIFGVEDRALFSRDYDEPIHVPGTLSGNHQRYLAVDIHVGFSSVCSSNADHRLSPRHRPSTVPAPPPTARFCRCLGAPAASRSPPSRARRSRSRRAAAHLPPCTPRERERECVWRERKRGRGCMTDRSHNLFKKKMLTGLPHVRHVGQTAPDWVEGGNSSGIESLG
uniref:Uncharacterized protein n=1 Tax=Oryza meridionalis TaxID=40149 RepID=A0A0E0CQ16_9ORYZ